MHSDATSDEDRLQQFRESLDTASFHTKPYARRIEKPWGYEIHFTPDDFPYMGKLLYVNEGARLSLQVHDVKRESWFLASGSMFVLLENAAGELEEIELQSGKGYTCQLGQKHRLKGGPGGGAVFEVSTPELGTTFRLEDDYARTSETEEARQKRNQDAVA